MFYFLQLFPKISQIKQFLQAKINMLVTIDGYVYVIIQLILLNINNFQLYKINNYFLYTLDLSIMADFITYSKLVSIIFKTFNQFRENPNMLIPVLEKRSNKYNQNHYLPNGDNFLMIQTQQGVVPVEQLIDQLRSLPKYSPLKWSYELHCAANHRAEHISHNYMKIDKSGNHINIQNQDLEDLVSSYADWNGSLSEHILYGFCDPIQILCELMIDDGNKNRQNRRQFLSPDLHDIGIGIQKHQKYQFVLVVIMATKAQKISRKYKVRVQPRNQIKIEKQQGFCNSCNLF